MQLCLEHRILMIPKVPVHHFWGWDTAPCSTSSHFPWTLNIPNWLSEMKLAQNKVRRTPTSCCISGLGRSFCDSCCGSRQNLFRCSLLPWEPSPALCHRDTTCPSALSYPRQHCQGQHSRSQGHRGCSSPACLAGHWPSVAHAPAGAPGAAGDAAPMPNPWLCRTSHAEHAAPSCWDW